MAVFDLLWQIGIISSIIVFGVKIGLASGLANLPKKYLLAICASYGVGVLALSRIASNYADQLVNMIYTYNSGFFIIMAVIMIVAGMLTIREWKTHNINTTAATCMVVIAPCPCCFGVIIATILLVAPTVSMSVFSLSQYVALALVLTIAITYFASNTIIKFTKKPYPIILGNFELFLGLYFLLSAILLPNIANVIGRHLGYVQIQSTTGLLLFVLFAVVLMIVGVIWTKKKSLFS